MQRDICAHPSREVDPVVANVCGIDGSSADGAGDSDGHQPGRTTPGDEYFLGPQVGCEGSMNCVAEILLQDGDFNRQRLRIWPGILSMDGNVFCESAIAIDADKLGVLTNVTQACPAE